MRRRRPRPGDKWHLDEVQLKINGRRHWLWRAVDQDGVVLDILVQPRRNQEAAEAFLRRLVDGHGYQPRVVITDKLASYPPAVRRVLPGAEHRRHKGLNNRAENSHRPTRRRERALQRFKSPAHAQQFLAPFGPIGDHFRPRRHLLPAPQYHPRCRPASRPGARSLASRPRPNGLEAPSDTALLACLLWRRSYRDNACPVGSVWPGVAPERLASCTDEREG